jgi:hypothetical protein
MPRNTSALRNHFSLLSKVGLALYAVLCALFLSPIVCAQAARIITFLGADTNPEDNNGTYPSGINVWGLITGSYQNTNVFHGLRRSADGKFTTFDATENVTERETDELVCSVAFWKAARKAWRAIWNGTARYETGFSIDENGRPGELQSSEFATHDGLSHVRLISRFNATDTFHSHNNYGNPRPSELDIYIVKTTHKMVYVGSRDGLYSVDPNGNVHHVFHTVNWLDKNAAAIHHAPCSHGQHIETPRLPEQPSNGAFLCSLVRGGQTECSAPGVRVNGHSIYVPGFGKAYFAESFISHGTRTLRFELGSTTGGSGSGGGGSTNGKHYPPG